MSGSYHVGFIMASQRQPRAGDQITNFVCSIIEQRIANTLGSASYKLQIVDLMEINLPFFDEPGIPQMITETAGYRHEHTRKWSTLIKTFDAIVFVTPQYNWNIPAGLKNAIDYLYHEWTGKPAMVVSYGGHGGDKADDALRLTMGGALKLRIVEQRVQLTFPGHGTLVKAAKGEDLGLDATKDDAVWSDQRDTVGKAWEELTDLLNNKDP